MSEDITLTALSPLDGRYREKIAGLAAYFSEAALIKYRIIAEISYFIFLSQKGVAPKLTRAQEMQLRNLVKKFSTKDAERVKAIEGKIRHDVKAVEYYLREEMQKRKIMGTEFIHFGLTSEDTNSIAYGFAIKESLTKLIVPQLNILLAQLISMAKEDKAVPMLARTHGQPAIPTTVGKEMIVFAVRIHEELNHLQKLPITAKLSGAVGTHAAHVVSFPEKDWIRLSQEFIKSLGLTSVIFTTQIVPADSYARIFQSLQLINTILIGFVQDIWRYVSDGYFVQRVEAKEVGSSTMPQKVNPIDFENAEGNLGLADALFKFFIDKLPISRLQRDLSDSTVKRNFGSAFGYSLLAYQNVLTGLQKVRVNQRLLESKLLSHWEIVTEGLQTILRTTGDNEAYEKLKQFSRGRVCSETEIKQFINSLKTSRTVKAKLEKLHPLKYVGLAEKIVDEGVKLILKT